MSGNLGCGPMHVHGGIQVLFLGYSLIIFYVLGSHTHRIFTGKFDQSLNMHCGHQLCQVQKLKLSLPQLGAAFMVGYQKPDAVDLPSREKWSAIWELLEAPYGFP